MALIPVRHRLFPGGAALIPLVLAVGCASADPGIGGDRPPTVATGNLPAELEPQDVDSDRPDPPGVAVVVTRIIDGDSFELSIDGRDDEARLIGVNAPEGEECFGDAARAGFSDRITGEEVFIETAGPERDDFGRLLVYVHAGSLLVNEQLVVDGLAVARDQSGHRLAEDFEAAEATARDGERGLWAPDACGEPTTAAVVIADIEPDAPGRDNENPNGEWIDIRNTGESAADLSGWVVKDESTRHRFELEADFVLAAGQTVRLYSGCGTDSATELYWCNVDDAVWNNGGDTVFLLDANGSAVDTLSY